MHIYFIVNPAAGRGRGMAKYQEIAACMPSDVTWEVHYTENRDDPERLAREACGTEVDIVAVIGGDGTLMEAARGMSPDKPFAVLPGGRGNDYCRAFGIPTKADEIVKMLTGKKTRQTDAFLVNDQQAIGIASVGFDVEVVRNSAKFSRFGSLSYYLSVFYTLFTYKPVRLTVSLDSQIFEGACYLIAAGKGNYYGGGMKVLPHADQTDHALAYCYIKPVTGFKVARLLSRFKKGNHLDIPEVTAHRCSEIGIQSEVPFALNIDGEIRDGIRSVQMKCVPDALKIVIPQSV